METPASGSTMALALALLASACARQAPPPPAAPAPARLLFVQSARHVTFDDAGQLTLRGVSPATLFFADRPQRIAGHVSTRRFLAEWDRGSDSFAADPPNATLSVLGARGVAESVLELSRPRLRGDDLTYQARVIEGVPPRRGGPSSLFIDDAARLGAPAFLARPELSRPYAWETYVYAPYAAPPMPPPSTAGTGPYGDLTTPSYYGENPYAEGWRDAPPRAYTFE